MQFEFISKLGNTRMLFNESDFNDQVNAAFKTKFETIGGQRNFIIQGIRQWKFPDHITSQVIQEIIHNTCFVCGGLMKNKMKMLTYEENPNSLTKIIRMCSQCGHSHT